MYSLQKSGDYKMKYLFHHLMFLHQLQDSMLLGYGKFKFYFLEISGLLPIFTVDSWLNPQMWTPRIWRADWTNTAENPWF